MGVDKVMEETLGDTEDGPKHEGTGADKVMEETLGGTKDGLEDNGTEWVTMVEYMVWEAWLNWEHSLREVHRYQWMVEVVTTFRWLLSPELGGAWSLLNSFQ